MSLNYPVIRSLPEESHLQVFTTTSEMLHFIQHMTELTSHDRFYRKPPPQTKQFNFFKLFFSFFCRK